MKVEGGSREVREKQWNTYNGRTERVVNRREGEANNQMRRGTREGGEQEEPVRTRESDLCV